MPQHHYGPLVRLLHYSVDQSINAALESMELTSAQGHVLVFLSRQTAPPCPRDLEEAFQLSHPTVSGLLSRMEKKGFIQLRTDEKDRRCKRIYVQSKGEECMELLRQRLMETEARLSRDFTPEEQASFRSLLERAISNMGGWPCQNCKEEPKE